MPIRQQVGQVVRQATGRPSGNRNRNWSRHRNRERPQLSMGHQGVSNPGNKDLKKESGVEAGESGVEAGESGVEAGESSVEAGESSVEATMRSLQNREFSPPTRVWTRRRGEGWNIYKGR